MARTMALCSLPRTNPGNRLQYKRVNGPFTLHMIAGGSNKLPFGNFPRLILAWVCTEAVRTQSRLLVLGPSLAKFMRELGVYSSGGGNVHTKLRNQMRRLFGCTVSMIYKDEHGEQFVSSLIAERGEFWWNKPDQSSLWDSKIYLGEPFFQEIINRPVPIDMNTLTALKRYIVSSAHFRNHKINWKICPHVTQERYEMDKHIQLAHGDILLMKDGAAMGKLAFVDELPGLACLNSHLLLFRPALADNGGIAYLPQFMFYYMQTECFQGYAQVNGTGATFLGISQESIGNHTVCLPPISEQTAVVEYLNHETADLDTTTASANRQINLLREYHTSPDRRRGHR